MRTYSYSVILIFLFLPVASFVCSQNPDIYKSDAIRFEWDQDYEKAAGLYEKAALLYEQNGKIDTMSFYKAGQNYVRVNRFSEAVPLLQRAVALEWPQYEAWFYLAEALQGTGNNDEAQDVLKQGMAVFPEKEPDFLEKMANISYRAERYEKALEFVNAALAINRTTTLLNLQAHIFEKSDQIGKAAEVYKEIFETSPEDDNARLKLAFLLFKSTNDAYKEEMERYKKMKNPSRVDYGESRKKLKGIAEGFREAIPYLETALEQDSANKTLMQCLYISHMRLGNNVEEQMYKNKLGL